ncbi:MAG: dehydratase [SAR202 cluster bacterium]|nr:dehydratase [SAR202 cluster bacterium]
MTTQAHYDGITEGTDLPVLVKHPTRRQLVMYAGASGDFNVFHYDQQAARGVGLPDVILHGALKTAFLSQMLAGWVGEGGMLRSLTVRYRDLDLPDTPLFCKGRVTRKYVEDGHHLVACDVWTENAQGAKTITGQAVVELPSRLAHSP